MDQNLADILETVNFIKDHMVMKDELPEVARAVMRDELADGLKPIEDRLTAVESKISGTNRRLDDEALLRGDLALSKRVSDLEETTFGASRHSRHAPLA